MTAKSLTLSAGLCFGVGVAAAMSLPFIALGEKNYFAAKEPCYAPPVPTPRNILKIRSDKYGKGYFAASRSGGRTHQGIDLTAAVGEPIFAAKSGRVTRAAEEPGYGKHIYIQHPDTTVTRYAHLESLCVSEGDWVTQGRTIGTCGKTGNAQNRRMIAHLHFEVRLKGVSLDPTSHGLFDPRIEYQY